MTLSLSLLGSFQIMLDDQPAIFATDSARALLAYLAVEADRPHRREALAGLLWPDQSDQKARSNLSQTLVRLRRAIGDYQAHPPLLLITAKTIQFKATSADLDVVRFQTLLAAVASHPHPDPANCPLCLERLQQAVNLYRGSFLQGLFLANSQSFEEWRLFKQEQLHRQAMEALHSLAGYYERYGLYEQAQTAAERQLTLEPWREEAHRQLMRALALSGQRSAALAQYEQCRRILAKELAVEPAPETTALYEQIRAGILTRETGLQSSEVGLLFDYLRRQHCLLILDNVETIMQQGNRAGQYRPGYEVYSQLIQRFGESEHQSCLLLTSRERPQGLARLAGGTSCIRFLHLAGLAEPAGQAILQRQGLSGPVNAFEQLVGRYSGHPLALKLIAQTIHQVFGGDIEAFLREETIIFDDIRDILDQQFARLSPLEQDIMLWLAIEREAVSPQLLKSNLVKLEAGGLFLEALRSLQRRSFLEQSAAGFTLQNVIMEYTTGRLIDQVYQEITSGPISIFQSHALIKTQAKEYVRQSQVRLILEPVTRRLVANLGQPPGSLAPSYPAIPLMSAAWPSVRMGRLWPAAVGTRRCACGRCRQDISVLFCEGIPIGFGRLSFIPMAGCWPPAMLGKWCGYGMSATSILTRVCAAMSVASQATRVLPSALMA